MKTLQTIKTKMTAARIGVLAVVGALAIGGISAGAIAHGKYDRDRDDRHGGRHIERIAERLSLTATQEARLEEILAAAATRRAELREAAETQIRETVSQESLSKADALRLMELRKQTRDEMKEHLAEQFAAFHAELNAEQRAEFAAIAPQLLAKAGGGHGKRGRHGRGHDGGRHGGHGHGDRDDDDHDDDRRGGHRWSFWD